MSKSAKFFMVVLFILVLVSLALNGLIIWQLFMVQRRLQEIARTFGPIFQESLEQTITELDEFEKTPPEFTILVDQDFPIQTEIAFNETLEVPLELTVPISQTIETTVFIELVGGVEVPVDIAVPVNVEVPIANTFTIPIERSIPISVTVPLKEEVVVKVDVAGSPLGQQLDRLREGLTSLKGLVEQLLAEVK